MFPNKTLSDRKLTPLISTWVLLLITLPALADTYPGADGSIEITPLLHASVQVEYQGLVLHIDPWGVIGTETWAPADIILVTDSPAHHKDVDAIEALSKPTTRIISPLNSKPDLTDAMVMAIGDVSTIDEITIEAIAAYDIIPGAPEHPRGDANGYVVTLGDKRILFAGVTECVDELQALQNINIAFMPMNIPVGRMTPQAAAECTRLLAPDHVYVYHYDQDWVRRLDNPDYAGSELPGGITVAESLDLFESELQGSGIRFVRGIWYPADE